MRRCLLLLFFAGALFLGAALAPLAFRAAQAWPALAAVPFPRFVSRVTLIVGLLLLWPLLRFVRPSPAELGLSRFRGSDLGRGALLGLLGLGGYVLVATVADARAWRAHAHAADLVRSIGLATLTAAVVAPLEEFVFRGMLFGLLRGNARPDGSRQWLPALAISSGVFALVHFLQTPNGNYAGSWTDGFAVLGRMFTAPAGAPGGAAHFVNLALCGALLAWCCQRTGTLWFSIGLHGGWIFWLKVANSLTMVLGQGVTWWGTRKVIDGWGATVVLAASFALAPLLARSETKPNATSSRLVAGVR